MQKFNANTVTTVKETEAVCNNIQNTILIAHKCISPSKILKAICNSTVQYDYNIVQNNDYFNIISSCNIKNGYKLSN